MEKTVFYVAFGGSDYTNPTLIEQFDNRADADTYAALMCRVKHRRYVVFEQVAEWDGTSQEN